MRHSLLLFVTGVSFSFSIFGAGGGGRSHGTGNGILTDEAARRAAAAKPYHPFVVQKTILTKLVASPQTFLLKNTANKIMEFLPDEGVGLLPLKVQIESKGIEIKQLEADKLNNPQGATETEEKLRAARRDLKNLWGQVDAALAKAYDKAGLKHIDGNRYAISDNGPEINLSVRDWRIQMDYANKDQQWGNPNLVQMPGLHLLKSEDLAADTKSIGLIPKLLVSLTDSSAYAVKADVVVGYNSVTKTQSGEELSDADQLPLKYIDDYLLAPARKGELIGHPLPTEVYDNSTRVSGLPRGESGPRLK